MTGRGHGRGLTLLAPLAGLYSGAIRLRNRWYDRPGTARRVEVPVISVGNLTVGGTGKTPLVGWIVRALLERGRRPAIVSRGYGGRAGRGPLLVSLGEGPQVTPTRCGDEPFMLALALRGALIVVGSDRVAGAQAAVRLGAEVIVLDDGFQHRRLARDLDVVLLDASRPGIDGRLLPAGELREPPSALRRADVVLLTRWRRGDGTDSLKDRVRRLAPGALVLRAEHRAVGFRDADGRAVDRPPRALAFCAIGSPETFRTDLERCGTTLVGFHQFRDHHPFRREELEHLAEQARAAGAALVTTEKDLARLGPLVGGLPPPRPVALRIEPEIEGDAQLLARIEALLVEPSR